MKQWITTLLAILLIGTAGLGGWLYNGKQRATEQLNVLQQELDQLQQTSQKLAEKATQTEADLQKDLSQTQDKLKVHESRAAQITAQVESLQNQVAGLAQTVKVKDQDLAQQGQHQHQMETQFKDLQGQAQQLVQSLQIKDQDLARVRTERERLEKLHDQLQATHAALKTELEEELRNNRATISALKDQVQVTLLDQIVFASAQTTISESGRAKLKKIAAALKAMTSGQIRIIGHTDNIPINADWQYKYPSNWELSATRAAAVARFFVDQGAIDPKLIQVVGVASHRPLADNLSDTGRRQNRRVEIILEGARK